VEHLNYCRQAITQFSNALENPGHQYREYMTEATTILRNSIKFHLPEGGRLNDDKTFKALDETQKLHLPFPVIALEYAHHGPFDDIEGKKEGRVSKTIIVAKEEDEWMILHIFPYVDNWEMWLAFPPIALPRINYLDRSIKSATGRTIIRILPRNKIIPKEDYSDELGAFLCFLNILQCANVHTESDRPRSLKKGAKNALPFDEYHYLTISKYLETEKDVQNENRETGNHRSPREHLRRGHIRRLPSAMVWVNATVVNSGRIGGKIAKEYVIGKGR
jgi:hypothetical protein